MEALNKKIPSQQDLIELLNDTGLVQIILTAVIYPVGLMSEISLIPAEAFSAVLSVMIFLISSRYLKSALAVTLFTTIYVTGITDTTVLIGISLGYYLFFRFLSQRNRALSLLITANFAHLGDAVTTYVGLKRGLSESNIFLNELIGLGGDWTIFLIKSVILPLTVYPYLVFSEETRDIYLKTVLGIGLYLVFRNSLFILEI